MRCWYWIYWISSRKTEGRVGLSVKILVFHQSCHAKKKRAELVRVFKELMDHCYCRKAIDTFSTAGSYFPSAPWYTSCLPTRTLLAWHCSISTVRISDGFADCMPAANLPRSRFRNSRHILILYLIMIPIRGLCLQVNIPIECIRSKLVFFALPFWEPFGEIIVTEPFSFAKRQKNCCEYRNRKSLKAWIPR